MDTVPNITLSQGFDKWYKTFQHTFMNIGLKFGYEQDEVRDVINQFFLDLLEKKIDPVSIRNPQAYLSTAFRRKLVDHYRQSYKGRVVELTDENYAELSTQDMLEKIESNTALIKDIHNAYKKLPIRCRKVMDMKFYKALTTEEIALQTGLSKRSVYNNLYEGVKLLRSELNHAAPGIHFAVLLSCLGFIIATFR